ncbi:integrase arm-type DNA-binding domain-containing protein [Parasphingorhabdus sp. JC815]|uniref:tyrosine-type recombinase/integrase n=1 Tax=Parasphingorhabdus sp. JC815 TaxID=3232140 RepID=UPI003457C0F7
MTLTNTRIRSLRPRDKAYKVMDKDGLFLQITPSGGKLWRFRYRLSGMEKKLSIGRYPEVSLQQARDTAIDARRLISSGGDPAFDKKKEKLKNEFIAGHTFGEIAFEYIENIMAQNGRAEATIIKAQYFLRQLKPDIGKRPIDKIEPFEILAILKRLEAQGKHETAKKCRSFASRVFRYAAATTRCSTDPTTMLQGALIKPKPNHYAAILDPTNFGELLRAIDGYEGNMLTRFALLVAPHVFVRPGELRHAEWHEINLGEAVWKIPPDKMKSRRMHAVPLSRQVVGYLEELSASIGTEGYVFPSVRSFKRPMSENTLNAAFRRMGFGKDEVTAHGLRATASTLLNECGLWNPDAIERSLAHGDSNAVRGVYHRGLHWNERVEMAQWWSDYLDDLRGGSKVAHFKTTRKK